MKGLAATLIASLSIIAPAHAAMMEHHDLSSLAMMSKHVVLAQRDFWTNGARSFGYTVTKVYKGSLLSGQRLYVSHSFYDLAGVSGRTGVPDRKAVLFLREGKDARLFPVASGIRVLFGGKVYRFQQWENPGPYVPVPQGRDPYDVRRGGRRDPVELKEFEADLQRAITRSAKLEDLLKKPHDRKRQRDLVELTGPEPRRISLIEDLNVDIGFYVDTFAARIIGTLIQSGDIEGAVDAVARARQWLDWHFGGSMIASDSLVELATASDQPSMRRITAVWMIQNKIVWMPPEMRGPSRRSVARSGLEQLVHDDDPRIRRAGVDFYRGTELTLGTLRDRWKIEKDPLVRMSILRAVSGRSDALSLLGEKELPPLYFFVEFEELVSGSLYVVDYLWGSLDRSHMTLEDQQVVISATGEDTVSRVGVVDGDQLLADVAKGKTPRSQLVRAAAVEHVTRSRFASDWEAGRRRAIYFDTPLLPGKYTFRLEARVESGAHNGMVVSAPDETIVVVNPK